MSLAICVFFLLVSLLSFLFPLSSFQLSHYAQWLIYVYSLSFFHLFNPSVTFSFLSPSPPFFFFLFLFLSHKRNTRILTKLQTFVLKIKKKQPKNFWLLFPFFEFFFNFLFHFFAWNYYVCLHIINYQPYKLSWKPVEFLFLLKNDQWSVSEVKNEENIRR